MPEPRRIYGWLQSPLSIARHYGGCMVDGVEYRIDYADPQRPLVEVVKVKRQRKAKKAAPADPLGDLLKQCDDHA